jgi:predicted TIM-barrel fold metal-dependent hydrolase
MGAAVALGNWASHIHAASDTSPAAKTDTLIDTHTHFYDPTRPQGVPWPPAAEKRLYRSVLPKDYQALPIPRPVTGTVVVEASPWVEDNQWVLDLAAKTPFILGFVGNLPLGTNDSASHLKRFAGNRLFRGIRIRDRRLEGSLGDAAFVRDLKLLADHDLSLDLVGGREILVFAGKVTTQVPSLRIIIDHLAGLRIDGSKPPSDWLVSMETLVGRPNVFFKLSGLVEGTGRNDGSAPRDVGFYRPVLDEIFKMFGPERLMYASNWPVSELFAPLDVVQGIVADYLRSHGANVDRQIFAHTSQAAYKWRQS